MADTQPFVQGISDKLPLILPTVTALLVVVLLQALLNFKQQPLAQIPVVGQELGGDHEKRKQYLARANELYNEGYQKFRKGIFRIVTSDKSPVLVVPPKFLNELRKLPDEILNFEDAVSQRAHFQYLKMAEGARMIPFTVKSSLTPALPRLGEILTDEIERAFRTELPPCESWTPVNINRKLLRIVALVSGRVFIGEELSRTEEYLDMSINYTLELMAVRRAVERMRPWLRPFLVSRLPEIRQLDARLAQADKILQPVVSARKQLADSEKPDDMLQWLLDTQEKHKRYTTDDIARVQLVITFAAIHTTTLTATNVFYNMAAYPQYVPELREEVRSVLAEHGGLYTTSALQSMKKLDSFIKESMRFDPPNAVAFSRKVRQSFTLSDGQVIPRGVIIEVPAGAVARDPTFFDNPDEFNPWRFSQLRQAAREKGEVETAAQHQFVSVNPTVLTFGYGAHACPGRFFAANEIKMILSYALNNYDIKLPEGVTERYPNVTFGTSSVPDPTKTLLFQRIR